jgi:hypothetical protein
MRLIKFLKWLFCEDHSMNNALKLKPSAQSSYYPIRHKLKRLEDMSHHQVCVALVSAELEKITFNLIHYGERPNAIIAQEKLEEWLIKTHRSKSNE